MDRIEYEEWALKAIDPALSPTPWSTPGKPQAGDDGKVSFARLFRTLGARSRREIGQDRRLCGWCNRSIVLLQCEALRLGETQWSEVLGACGVRGSAGLVRVDVWLGHRHMLLW